MRTSSGRSDEDSEEVSDAEPGNFLSRGSEEEDSGDGTDDDAEQ